MGDDDGASGAGAASGLVGRAVIDDGDIIAALYHIGDDATDDSRFVVSGDDQPDRSVGFARHSSPSDATQLQQQAERCFVPRAVRLTKRASQRTLQSHSGVTSV